MPLADATNSSLLLTNLSVGGDCSAVVTNSLGSVTSEVATLTVVSTAPRVLWVRGVSEAGGGAGVTVPLVLHANGRENTVQHSLSFDTNTSVGLKRWLDRLLPDLAGAVNEIRMSQVMDQYGNTPYPLGGDEGRYP